MTTTLETDGLCLPDRVGYRASRHRLARDAAMGVGLVLCKDPGVYKYTKGGLGEDGPGPLYTVSASLRGG